MDILSYAAYKISGKPKNEVLGSGTTLDTARFRYLLAKYYQINARNVHAYILGEHGDSEFPIWSSAMIGGILIKDYHEIHEMQESERDLNGIFESVKNSAYKIIERKGETSYGIGLALARISKAIINDENTILSVSTLIEDYYGMNDLYLSLPSIINKKGVQESLKISLNKEEAKQFRYSAEKIKEIIQKTNFN